jgi:hypothetical protein
MAKIIAPFLIKGTIEDINFVVTADGENYARMRGNTWVTAEQFKNNPIYDRIREQGQEFGQCAKKSAIFRQLALNFNQRAKDGSVAGRANKLLFEILQEDATQPQGKRTLIEGLKTSDGKEALLFFESNKIRPLKKVLKIGWKYKPEDRTFILSDFMPSQHLDWPEEATHVQIAIATANWDYEKMGEKQNITLLTAKPLGDQLHLTFLFIGFLNQERKKLKFLHRKYNTTTVIAHHTPI